MTPLDQLLEGKSDEDVLINEVVDGMTSGNAYKEAVVKIKKKISSFESDVQIRALCILEKLIDKLGFPFHEAVGSEDFISTLSRIIDRNDLNKQVKEQIIKMSSDWENKFSSVSDLLPNFQNFHAKLTQNNLSVQQSNQEIDKYLINEAEGQDPEEFIIEVRATLALFDDVSKVQLRDTSQNEALISLASNLDRYSEQLELWMQQLEAGDWMTKAIELNERVIQALERFRQLRVGS